MIALGPLRVSAQLAVFDTFIAFMGMDVRVHDSDHFRGKRKLTKKGEPELRRILFNAAMRGWCDAHWEPYYLTRTTPMRLQSDIESILDVDPR